VLHTPNYDVHTRAFCGPTAISTITGLPISVIRDAIRKHVGTKSNGDAKAIMGVSNEVLVATMRDLGWKVTIETQTDNQVNRRDPFRLWDFIQLAQQYPGKYIVNVTGHYYAVDGDEICDTFTKIPMELNKFKRGRNRWVKRWWRFEPFNALEWLEDAINSPQA
jgi:hypothetical protein